MKLPSELRNKVYRYVLGKHYQIQSTNYKLAVRLGCSMYSVLLESPDQWSWHNGYPIRVSSTDRSQTGLLLANREISKEVSYILYSASTFHFDDPESLSIFLLATPERHLAVITKLMITIILPPEDPVYNAWLHIIGLCVTRKMKRLKLFEVSIWAIYPEPHLRASRCAIRLRNSVSMPCLEHGAVALVRDRPRKRIALGESVTPAELAEAVVGLLRGRSCKLYTPT